MIIEYIRYTLTRQDPASFSVAFAEAGKCLLAAPECLGFEVSQCADDARSFILRIRWTSLSDHLEGFRKGPHFQPFLSLVQAYIPDIVEMRHYQVIAGHDRSGAEISG